MCACDESRVRVHLHACGPDRRKWPLLAVALVSGFVLGAGFFRLAGGTPASGAEAISQDAALYLTWTGDPTTTMTVSWLTAQKDTPSFVLFRARGESTWREAAGRAETFPHTEWDLHRVELTGLQPGARYDLLVPGEPRIHAFETLPARLQEPLRFCVGGDVGKDFEAMDRVNRLAGARDPAFVAWGGDLAYCNSRPHNAWRWQRFFQSVHHHLRAPDGRLIPLVVAPGNHEVRSVGGENRADFFFAAFPPTGGKTYRAFNAGDYLSLLLLDTGHLTAIEGEQTTWLGRALADRRDRAHIFPIYHAAAYPSARDPGQKAAPVVREHWVPLFEKHGVRLAFEHHDHAFKITHPIRAGRIDPAGIVYAGDGAWGVPTRRPRPDPAGHFVRAAPTQHFHEVTLEPARRTVQSWSADGGLLHAFSQEVEHTASDSSSSRHVGLP